MNFRVLTIGEYLEGNVEKIKFEGRDYTMPFINFMFIQLKKQMNQRINDNMVSVIEERIHKHVSNLPLDNFLKKCKSSHILYLTHKSTSQIFSEVVG